MLVIHHVATDGWSAGIFARDLSQAYAARRQGRAPGWDPLPVQYADYSIWQRELLGPADDQGSLLARQAQYWRRTPGRGAGRASLPADRPRPQLASHRGSCTADFSIPAQVHAELMVLAR